MLPGIFWIVPAAGVVTVIFAIFLARGILKRPTGTPKMKEKRQYSTIAIYSVVIAIIIGIVVAVLGSENVPGYTSFDIGWRTSVAFLVGAICSGAAGFIGMYIAVKSNVRCAAAAQKSLEEAVKVAHQDWRSRQGETTARRRAGGWPRPLRPARRRYLHQGR